MELFQLDQPDLDFGIYRILHARSAEVSAFLATERSGRQTSLPAIGGRPHSLNSTAADLRWILGFIVRLPRASAEFQRVLHPARNRPTPGGESTSDWRRQQLDCPHCGFIGPKLIDCDPGSVLLITS